MQRLLPSPKKPVGTQDPAQQSDEDEHLEARLQAAVLQTLVTESQVCPLGQPQAWHPVSHFPLVLLQQAGAAQGVAPA